MAYTVDLFRSHLASCLVVWFDLEIANSSEHGKTLCCSYRTDEADMHKSLSWFLVRLS